MRKKRAAAASRVPAVPFDPAVTRWASSKEASADLRVEVRGRAEQKELPSPVYSAHWIENRGLRHAVADYLDRERPAVLQGIEEMTAEMSPYRQG